MGPFHRTGALSCKRKSIDATFKPNGPVGGLTHASQRQREIHGGHTFAHTAFATHDHHFPANALHSSDHSFGMDRNLLHHLGIVRILEGI
jgi:hypothetical protein